MFSRNSIDTADLADTSEIITIDADSASERVVPRRTKNHHFRRKRTWSIQIFTF